MRMRSNAKAYRISDRHKARRLRDSTIEMLICFRFITSN
ncbi:hypothetical protein RB8417 [Rhodopirellula baltica SH 1]|uniref:Uncharacterized protein n=1 Tax=Rhodopirellula baltica (strain DSM 10527 / NCIMB 13988 / SH1) TaxID=243090 RepID=Q7UFQ1_RHOBA|nr:hypothetical protein RB8417 [Rhodopirellula baltica SH 1]